MNNKKKYVAALSSAALTALIVSAFTNTAYAKTTGFLTTDNGKNFEYSYNNLMDSAVQHAMGLTSPLYDNYMKQTLTAFKDDVNGYVNQNAVMQAAITAAIEGKTFNLDNYTEKVATAADIIKDVTGVSVVTVGGNGEIVTTPVETPTGVTVSSVSAINETAVQATGLATTVKEADLVGKKVTLKAGDVSLTATYVATSLTTDGKANFVLDDSKKLTDAATYTVSADWASFTTNTFVAKVADTYIKTIDVSTTAIQAANTNKVYFTAKNQYGEDLALAGKTANVKVTGTLNGVPMLASEISIANIGDGYVTISKALAKGDAVVLKFTNQIANVDTQVGTTTFTTIDAATSVATTISNMAATYATTANGHTQNTVAKEVMPDDQITLSAVAKDQFGNPISNASLRWVVEAGDTLITKTTQTNNQYDVIDTVSDAATFTFRAVKAGNVQISAYIGNGQKVTYQVTVGAKALNALNLDSPAAVTGVYNQDDNIVKTVTPNTGANLTVDQIKFDVKATKTTVDVTPADVTVTASLRGAVDKNATDQNKNDIVIVVKSGKPGKYTITPYVGESLEKATAKATAFDVTTAIDQTVASIDDITFDAKELKTNVDIKKDITFRNKHNEVVVINDNTVVPAATPLQGITATVTKDTQNNKNVLTINASAAKAFNLVVADGDVFKTFNLTFTAPTFTTVNAGADITGVVAGDKQANPQINKYQAISFLDQDGKVMNVQNSAIAVSITDPNGAAVADASKLITLGTTYTVAQDGTVTFTPVAQPTDNVVAFAVSPDGTLAAGTYTVKVASTDGKIADTFTVTVGTVRAAKTVDITAASTNVGLGGQTTVKVTPKDQYGNFIAVGTTNIQVNAGANFTAGQVTEVNKDGGVVDQTHPVAAYAFTLTGNTKGINDVVVNVMNNQTVLTTNKVSMTVGSVASLVDSVAIDNTGLQSLYSTAGASGATVNLKAIAKDTTGNAVPVSASDLIWSLVSQTDADGKAVSPATVAVDANGAVTAQQNTTGSAIIKVQTANLKTATITLNFDKAAIAAKPGTTAVVNNATAQDGSVLPLDADTTKDGIQVALDNDAKDGEANGAVKVKLTAKDQYGTAINSITTGIVAIADDTSVVTPVVGNDGVITITAKSVGTSNVYVQYNGDTIKLEVTANDAAVTAVTAAQAAQAAQALATADQAAEQAVAAYEAKVATTYTGANYAATEKQAAADKIAAYKALAADADDAKYDARKAAADQTNTTKQASYNQAAQDQADVAAVKGLVAGTTYSMPVGSVTDEASVKTQIESIISGLTLNGVATTVTKVDYTAAVASTSDGSYTFTVALSKGTATDTTTTLTMTITQ